MYRLAVVVLTLAGCFGPEAGDEVGAIQSTLGSEARRTRLMQIRMAAADVGLTNAVLLAGIAQNETGLAHCWSEAMGTCMGPTSAECGGPVLAGAADGPCDRRQGGLGMFQFDAGDYDDTLEREGDRILSIAGNVQAALDFVTAMVIRSRYIEGVDTREQAIAWMNEVRVDGYHYTEWLQTVVHYYNGCVPGSCMSYERKYGNYDGGTHRVLGELGDDFWYAPLEPCMTIPAEGAIVDERDARCTTRGGDLRYWREVEDAGNDGTLIWTYATDNEAASNYFEWHFAFTNAGRYAIDVYTDARYARSRSAPYLVAHGDGVAELVIDQTLVDGWTRLGEYEFPSATEYVVRLEDDSGETRADEVQIAADAIRFTPVEIPPEIEVDPRVVTDLTAPFFGTAARDAGPGTTVGPTPPRTPIPRDAGGCAAMVPSPRHGGIGLACLLALFYVVAINRRSGAARGSRAPRRARGSRSRSPRRRR